MTAHRRSGAPKGDYAVGYGRPPPETRFQKGKSGNPRGRPKGSKSLSQLLTEKFAQRVTVQENGTSRQMGMLEVLVHKLINDAARGNLRATRLVLDLWERCGEFSGQNTPVGDLAAEDRAIINAYLQKVRSEATGEDFPSASPDCKAAPAKGSASQTKGRKHAGK